MEEIKCVELFLLISCVLKNELSSNLRAAKILELLAALYYLSDQLLFINTS
ncbi:UNVERIFIED_CONTAM: hypothetical protein MX611_12000 [Staphylococcus haemolyticus]